jgi:hypothetical protein
MPPDDERDYPVGYGKPPPHSRFVKGQSGNPRGRPPGAKNMKTLLTKAMNKLKSKGNRAEPWIRSHTKAGLRTLLKSC